MSKSARSFFQNRARASRPFVDTAKLNAAFKALRKAGLVARQNFSCCGGCAGSQIAEEFGAADEAKRAARMKGGVYFHKQNGEALKNGGDLYVSFGQIEYTAADKTKIVSEMKCVDVGKLAVRIFEEAGLKVEWSGSANFAILIKADPPKDETPIFGGAR